MHPKELAEYYRIDAQAEGESDDAFRRRVAARLREKGRIIEAHEVLNNCRWDDEENGKKVTDSLTGAIALAVNGSAWNGGTVMHPGDGERQLGDDFCAGVVATDPRPKMTPEAAMLMMAMFGGSNRI